MKLRYIFVLLVMVLALGACDPNDTIEDYTVEYTSTGEMLAGEWYVTYTLDGDVWATNSKISTFNTAADNGSEMWIDDDKNFWGLKSKVNCNPADNSFSVEGADELYYGITVNIKNGKVLPGAGTTAAGNVTDSIYMEIEYSDQAGTFIVAGVRRTGFLEDEHE
ncbi:MAG: lipid-binding protein [Marinifilaceae bacterium]